MRRKGKGTKTNFTKIGGIHIFISPSQFLKVVDEKYPTI